MSDFHKNTRVQVPAALHLCKLGYTYLDDNDIMVYDYGHENEMYNVGVKLKKVEYL